MSEKIGAPALGSPPPNATIYDCSQVCALVRSAPIYTHSTTCKLTHYSRPYSCLPHHAPYYAQTLHCDHTHGDRTETTSTIAALPQAERLGLKFRGAEEMIQASLKSLQQFGYIERE